MAIQHNQHHHHPRSMNACSLSKAAGYVLSGCCQPLLMQLLRDSGLADAKAQLYMFFYYLGPALVILPMLQSRQRWPTTTNVIVKAIGIAFFDTAAASMNYTGASLAGPTIFAVIYASVTVWTAIFSKLVLGRSLIRWHWMSIFLVFGGLALTATDSIKLGDSVLQGCILIMVGSAAHAMTYILCEAIMTIGDDKLTVEQNCGIQATVALITMGLWQLFYTIPNWQEVVGDPIQQAGTGLVWAMELLILFAFCNWVHAITFFETLLHFPGGATTAGVLKGLQAALVFVATHLAFCGRTGGEELCITNTKIVALVLVVGGVILYGLATQHQQKTELSQEYLLLSSSGPAGSNVTNGGHYDSIETKNRDIESVK